MKRDGYEPVDDTPVEVPLEFRRPPGEVDRLREMILQVSAEIAEKGGESFEESLDFDIDHDGGFDGGPEDDLTQSEARLMREEFLASEAAEADRILAQRRAETTLRGKRGAGTGKEDSGARADGVQKSAAKAGGESGDSAGAESAGSGGSGSKSGD